MHASLELLVQPRLGLEEAAAGAYTYTTLFECATCHLGNKRTQGYATALQSAAELPESTLLRPAR